MHSTTDPRKSPDRNVVAALAAWDLASNSRAEALQTATALRAKYAGTDSHQAYGWSTATCGRVLAYRGDHRQAELFLTEALGRLFFFGDEYALRMIEVHLAILLISADPNRALKLVNG